MPEISMKNMLEAGVHFGHQTHRWNPKMKDYIFGPRNGIYIIDLEKTAVYAKEACNFLKKITENGGKVLFVATKQQASEVTKLAAERAGMPFVVERWLGGTLTNFTTIRQGVERLEQLEMWKEDGTYEALPKKEVIQLERKRGKLELSLGGIRTLKGLPAALFVIDPENEKIAVREANRLGVPVVALVDTNCNPDPIDFVIPGNDDALKSVTLFANLIADSCLEGSQLYEQNLKNSNQPQQTPEEKSDPKSQGPLVEKVAKKKLKIPTDFDFREPTEEEEAAVVVAVETPEEPPKE